MNDHSDHPPTLEGRHIPTSSSSLRHLPPSPTGDLLTPSQLETTTTNRIDPNDENDDAATTTINATTTTTTIGPTVSMSLSSPPSVPSSLPLSSSPSLSSTTSSLSCLNHPPSVSSTTSSSTEPSSSAVALRQRHNISTTIPEHEIESHPYQQEDHRKRTQPHTSSTSVVQSPPSLSNDAIDTATTTTTPTTPSHLNHHHHSTSTHTNCTTATATDTTTTTTTTTSTTTPPTIVAIKLLISNNIAGSIIGRMGQSISELQLESQTRIKISQSSDYYPGTIDRVCLIQATSIRPVQQAVRLIVQRYYHIQQTERTSSPPLGTMTTHYGGTHMNHTTVFPVSVDGPVSTTTTTGTTGDGFDFVIRLLVPVTCCGMIIGKSGSNIKYMEESSGVMSVRLTSKDDMVPHISNHNNNNNNNNQHHQHHPNYNNNNNSHNSTGYATTSTATIMIPTNERIVTITSMTVEQCVQCIYIILDSMMAHPEISQYTNMTTSYVSHHHHPQQQPPPPHHHQTHSQQRHSLSQPQTSYHHHNPLMVQPQPPSQQQLFVRRRVYHVPSQLQPQHLPSGLDPPPPSQQPPPPQMYWTTTTMSSDNDGMGYHSTPSGPNEPNMIGHNHHHLQPNQTSANHQGMNRRIASSPNFSMAGGQSHHHDSRRDASALLGKASTGQQGHNHTTFSLAYSQSNQPNPSQPPVYVSQDYGSATITQNMDSSGLTNVVPHQRSNNMYQLHQNSASTYQYQPTNAHTWSDGLIVSQSTSTPNLLSMQMEQSLVLTQPPPNDAAVGSMKQSDSISSTKWMPASPLQSPSSRLLHPSVFQHQGTTSEPSQYHMPMSHDPTMGGATTAATALALQMPTMIVPGCFTAQVLVPDAMIGSILGRGGRTLTELQLVSNTNIRISQRNEYMPGTRSRIVTIRGPNTQSVWQAQYMLSQRLTNVMTTPGPNTSTAPVVQYYHQQQHAASDSAIHPSGTSNAVPNSTTIQVEHPGIVSPPTTATASSSSLSSSTTTSPGTAYPGARANNHINNITTSDEIPTQTLSSPRAK